MSDTRRLVQAPADPANLVIENVRILDPVNGPGAAVCRRAAGRG